MNRSEKCSIADDGYLAALNKDLIYAKSSDNPMKIRGLEQQMKDFLQTGYEAYYFLEQNRVFGFALI